MTRLAGSAGAEGATRSLKSQQVACSASANDCPKARITSASEVAVPPWTCSVMAGRGVLNRLPCRSTERIAVAMASGPSRRAVWRCSRAKEASSRRVESLMRPARLRMKRMYVAAWWSKLAGSGAGVRTPGWQAYKTARAWARARLLKTRLAHRLTRRRPHVSSERTGRRGLASGCVNKECMP